MTQATLAATRPRPFGRRIGLLVVGLVLAGAAMLAWGSLKADGLPSCTKTWVPAAGVSGNYSTAANWSPSGRPVGTDYACAGPGTIIVYSDAISRTVGGINFQGSLSISNTELRIGTTTTALESEVDDLTINSIRGGRSQLTVRGTLVTNSSAFIGTPYATIATRGGSTILAPTATYDIANGLNIQSDQLFRNEGTVTWTGGYVYQHENSDIVNAGAWELPSDGYYVYDSNPPESTFTNASTGVLTKEATGFTSAIYTPFENDGLVDVDGDLLYVEGEAAPAGTDAGDWDIAAGATVQLQYDRTFTGGASVIGDGTLEIANGTVDLGPVTAMTNLRVTGGIVNGSPTISGSLDWQGGTFDGAGTATIESSATATIGVNTSHTLDNGYTLRNEGDLEWSGGPLSANSAATFENAGQVTITDLAGYSWSGGGSPFGTFVNEATGTITKTATGVSNYLSEFENHGAIEVEGDTLVLYAQPTTSSGDDGSIDVSAGAVLDLQGDRTFVGGLTSNTGTLRVSGGLISGDLDIAGGFDWAGGTFDGAGTTTLTSAATATISTGSDHNLDNGYTLRNEGDLTWESGNVYGYNGATLENAGQLTITDTGGYGWYVGGSPNGLFVNESAGTITKTATGVANYLYEFENHGAIEVEGDSLYLAAQPLGSTGDDGTIDVSPGATLEVGGDRSFVGGLSTNGGTLRVSGGTVSGDLTVGSAFVFTGGTITGELELTGSFDWQGGTFDGAATATLTSTSTSTIGGGCCSHLLENGYTLRNEGDLTWSAGHVTANNASTFENAGLVTITDTGGYGWYTGGAPLGTFVNESAGTITKTATGGSNYLSEFENHGTVEVEGDALVLYSQPATSIGDDGTYDISPGATLDLQGDRTFVGGLSTSTGTLRVSSGTISGDLQVDSTLQFVGGTISGDVDISTAFDWQGGTFDGAGTTTFSGNGAISTGTWHYLTNGYTFRNQGVLTWSNGYIHQCTDTTFENAGTLNITDGGGYSLYDCGGLGDTLVNEATGTIAKTAGANPNYLDIPFTNDGKVSVSTSRTLQINDDLTNLTGTTLTGGTYEVLGNGALQIADAAGGITVNAATIRLNGSSPDIETTSATNALSGLTTNSASGTLEVLGGKQYTVTGPFANAGTVNIGGTSSRITVNGASTNYTQSAGSTNLTDATALLRLSGATAKVFINGGTLTGVGTVEASLVTNAAQVAPGASPGVLSITGAYAPTVAGTLNVELNGTTPGTGHDQLVATGAVTLNGTLALTKGYVPTVADAFTVVSGASRTGTFSTITGQMSGLNVIRAAYNPANVTLTTVVAPVISIGSTSIAEGNAGSTNLVLPVTLDSSSPDPVTVHWSTSNGSATQPGDYTSSSGTVTFVPTDVSETISIPVIGDTTFESDETFTITLDSPTMAVIGGGGTATGTIQNDDASLTTLSVNDVTLSEGNSGTTNAVFTVSLNAASAATVTVHHATANDTATAPGDYTSTSGDLTFDPGQTSKQVSVPVVGDTVYENNETFFVNLSSPTGASLADGQGVGTIQNDEAVPTISIGDVSLAEGNAGTTNASFAVTLSAPSQPTVTVGYTTANNSAVAPGDYTTTSGTVTFVAGDTSETIAVPVVGDTASESNEAFFVNLSSPTVATIADAQGVGTITNDDVSGNSLSGVVKEMGTNTPLTGIQVRVWNAAGTLVGSTATAAGGTYNVGGLPDGSYRIRFHSTSGAYKLSYYNNMSSLASATQIPLSGGASTTINMTMGLSLSGTVTEEGSGTPLNGVVVRAWRADGTLAATATTTGGGLYNFGLAPDAYRLRFTTPTATHKTEFHLNQPSLTLANPITLVSGAPAATVANAALAQADGVVSGTVTEQGSGTPLAGIQVRFYNTSDVLVGTTTTGAGGTYTFGLPPGSYKVRFTSPTNSHLLEYFDGVTTIGAATPISVVTMAITTLNEALIPVVPLSGTVIEDGTGTPLAGVRVRIYRSDGLFITEVITAVDGTWSTTLLGPGNYKIRFNTTSGSHVLEWNLNKATQVTADIVALVAGTPVVVNASLDPV